MSSGSVPCLAHLAPQLTCTDTMSSNADSTTLNLEGSLSPLTPLDLDAGIDVAAPPPPQYAAAPVYHSRGLSLSLPNTAPVTNASVLTQHLYVRIMNSVVEAVHVVGQNQLATMRHQGATAASIENIAVATGDIGEAVDDITCVLDGLVTTFSEEMDAHREILERVDVRTQSYLNSAAVNETNINMTRATLGIARDNLSQLSAQVADLQAVSGRQAGAIASVARDLDQLRVETALGIADLAKTGDAIRGHIADLAGAMAQVVSLMHFPGTGPATGPTAPPPAPPPPPPTPFSSPVAGPSTLSIRTSTADPRIAPYSVSSRKAKVNAANAISTYFHRPALASIEPDELQDDASA